MTARLTAEWRKLVTIRTFYWLLAGAAVVAALVAFATTSSMSQPPWPMTTPLHDQMMWALATMNGAIFAIIVGARTFTDEFRHDTIAHTFIADPGRVVSTLAKAGAAFLAGALVGVVTVVALAIVALLMALSSGAEVATHSSDLLPAVGLIGAMGLWGAIGAGFGAIVRHQVAVVAVGLVWILMLENLGAGLLEEAGRFLPGQTVHAMAQTREAIDLLAVGPAALLMAGYAATFVACGLLVNRRRDIA